MFTIIKDKNLVKITPAGKTKYYAFDINTGIFYGLQSKPICTTPSIFREGRVHPLGENYNASCVTYLLDVLICTKGINALRAYQKAFVTTDKLDAIGYNNFYDPLKLDTLDFIEGHFKEFSRAFRDNSNLTIYDFQKNYGYEIWKKVNKLETTPYLPEEIIALMYRRRDEFPPKYLSYVVYYLSHGILDFYDFTNEIGPYRDHDSERHTFSKIKKYFQLCDACGIKPEKEDFYRSYINVRRTYVTMRTKVSDSAITKLYSRFPQLTFSNDKYQVVIPATTQDFLNEANNQDNCVYACYLARIIKQQTIIVFIRKKETLNKSFITCEINPQTFHIVQYLGKCNSEVKVNSPEYKFKIAYEEYLQQHKGAVE